MHGSFFSGVNAQSHLFYDDELEHVRGAVNALDRAIRVAQSNGCSQTEWHFTQARDCLKQILSKRGSIPLIRASAEEHRYVVEE